jgi:membrane-bound lytic murein transglycosylase D
MAYVPKLLAVAKVFANAEKYHIKLLPIPNKPVFEVVNIGSQLDLTKAAEMAAISLDDLFLFNPGHKRWHSDPNGPHRLLIPIEKAQLFKTNLAKLPKKDRMRWLRHKIKSGENLSLIAHKHQTSVPAIRAANRLPSNKIRAGRHLLIPLIHHPRKRHPLQAKSLVYRSGSITHIVKRGDSFWDIARKYSVSSKKIARWNNLALRSILRPGQKLVIHKSKQPGRSAKI